MTTVALFAAVSVTSIFSTGCQSIPTSYPEPVNQSPLLVDQAMQKRSWDVTVAEYPNGGVVAGNMGYYLTPRDDLTHQWEYYTHATGVYLVNVVLLPYELLSRPSKQVYDGVVVDATYTAQPPLP